MSPFRSAAKPTPVRDPSAGNNPSSHIAYVLIPPISGQFHMMATVLVQLEGHGGYPGGQERGRPPTPLSFSAPTCRSMHHAAAGADFVEFSATKSSVRLFPWNWPVSGQAGA